MVQHFKFCICICKQSIPTTPETKLKEDKSDFSFEILLLSYMTEQTHLFIFGSPPLGFFSVSNIITKKQHLSVKSRIYFELKQRAYRAAFYLNVQKNLKKVLPFSVTGGWMMTCIVVTAPTRLETGLRQSLTVLLFSNTFPALINFTSFTVLGPFSFSTQTKHRKNQ